MKIFYDTEFVDDGERVGLLSIGMVADDGRELYRIIDDEGLITRAVADPWLRHNVVPHLPVKVLPSGDLNPGENWDFDDEHEDWHLAWNRQTVADPSLLGYARAVARVARTEADAAYERGFAEGRRETAEEVERICNAQHDAHQAGLAEGRSQEATEGLSREVEYALRSESEDGSAWYSEPYYRRDLADIHRDEAETVVQRTILAGPWEPAERPGGAE